MVTKSGLNGMAEKLQRIFKSHGSPPTTNLSTHSDHSWSNLKTNSTRRNSVDVYIVLSATSVTGNMWQTARSLGTSFKEHTDGKHPNSVNSEHTSESGHTLEDVKVLDKQEKWFPRKIREAINIHKRKPVLNHD